VAAGEFLYPSFVELLTYRVLITASVRSRFLYCSAISRQLRAARKNVAIALGLIRIGPFKVFRAIETFLNTR
jgi:hypothetical protein